MNKKLLIINKLIKIIIMLMPIYICNILVLWVVSAPNPYYLFIFIKIITLMTLAYTTLFLNAYLTITISNDTYDIIKWEWIKPEKHLIMTHLLQGLPYLMGIILNSYVFIFIYLMIDFISACMNKETKSISERLIHRMYKEKEVVKVIV